MPVQERRRDQGRQVGTALQRGERSTIWCSLTSGAIFGQTNRVTWSTARRQLPSPESA
jgi:hypothetical protein